MTLDCDFSTEGTCGAKLAKAFLSTAVAIPCVSGVLCDFHLLHLLSERCAIASTVLSGHADLCKIVSNCGRFINVEEERAIAVRQKK